MRKNKSNRLDKAYRKEAVLDIVMLRYFKENNIGFGDTRKEAVLNYRTHKAWDKAFWDRDENIEWDMNVCIAELRKELPSFKKYLKYFNDGSTPYGTDADYGNLCYISDRWRCQGRLEFLIELLERNWTYKKVPEKDYPDQTTWEKI